MDRATVPFLFESLEYLPFCVIADDFVVDETAQLEPLGSKLRHVG